MSPTEPMPVVFTAQSKVFFYCRDAVCEFVLQRNAIPVNPFRVFEYFLGDRVDRDLVRQGNNNLIRIVDELWVFGETIADGVWDEIFLAKKLEKPIQFFTIDNRAEKIREVSPDKLRFEQKLYHKDEIKRNYKERLKRSDLLAEILEDYNLKNPPDPPPEQLKLFSARVKN